MTKKTMITSGVIVFAVLILIFIFLLMLGSNEVDSPTTTPIEATTKNNNATIVDNGSEEASLEVSETTETTEANSRPRIRFVTGVIKEVNDNSIIVTDTKGEDNEVSFDAYTEILKGEGMGEEATISDLATNWNAAVFLPNDKENNIAQKIQMISENIEE